MKFGEALDKLIEGRAMTRTGWNGKGMSVKFAVGGANVCPYFIMYKADGFIQPGWVPSIGDLLADDWQEFKAQS
ncbi:MAG: DUF2829 domain-containing protein [Patescibacteria group bacterium]